MADRLTGSISEGAELVETEQLRLSAQRLIERERGLVMFRRLALVQLLFAVAAICLGQITGVERKTFGLIWILVAGTQAAIVYGTLSPRFTVLADRFAFVSLALAPGWFVLPFMNHLTPDAGLVTMLVLLAPISLPLGFLHSFIVCLHAAGWALAIVALSAPDYHPAGLIVAGLATTLVAAGVSRTAFEQRTYNAARVAFGFLGRYCASGSAVAMTTLRLITWSVAYALHSRSGVIIPELGSSEVLRAGRLSPSSVDTVFLKAFTQRLKDLRLERGFLKTKELGDQFLAPLYEWFGYLPKELFVLRFLVVLDEREQQVSVAVPLTRAARVLGRSRVTGTFSTLADLAQISFAAARGRFLASDSLLLSQRALSERENEMNELVHLVNNVAQDIAMQCEDLSAVLNAPQDGTGSDAALREKFQRGIRELEITSRSLSSGVTDRKLLRELMRLKNLTRKETALLVPILKDVELAGAYRARRSGNQFQLSHSLSPSAGVQVASREFLETCLRILVRASFENAPAGCLVTVKAAEEKEEVRIQVHGFPGPRWSEEHGAIEGGGEEARIRNAVENFIALSGGAFHVGREQSPISVLQAVVFTITLPLDAARPASASAASTSWALFVDDNPQVTTFYARVAEALDLQYRSAASVEAAREIVAAEGRPRLVVSDIQLGDESGLELVRYLRSEFGGDLPIIVVSGNVGEDVGGQVRQAGATGFLAKPVGRARLLSEIQAILANTAR